MSGVPFFRVELSETEIAEVTDSLRNGWLTTGPKVKQFEKNFAERLGVKHAIAVNSCTAAMHLALEAIGIKQGDMVLAPTLTFAATAEVVRYFGAIPVFVDCDDTWCMDPEALEKTILDLESGKPTAGLSPSQYGPLKAVIPMHYGGYCCDMDKITAIAEQHDLTIVEDAAHAFPSKFKTTNGDWKDAGRFGKVGCFSFYANKCITTGEGGMAITDDDELAERMQVMSLHGMSRDAWKRFQQIGSWYYEIIAPGYKYNMTDLAGALGLHQLERADELLAERLRVATRLNAGLAECAAIHLPPDSPETHQHSWHLYEIGLNLDTLRIDRAAFIDELVKREVFCSVHYLPLHMHPYYVNTYGYKASDFPNAAAWWPRLISLPIFPTMRDDEVDYVVESVQAIADEFKA